MIIASAEQMRDLGRAIGSRVRSGDVIVLIGDLGAGKTTLVQGLAPALGVRDAITSPTFVIAREHRADGRTLQHVDAYRLASPADFWDLDLDLASSVTVIEWGESLLDDLTDDPVLVVRIDRDESTRRVTLSGSPVRWPPETLDELMASVTDLSRSP